MIHSDRKAATLKTIAKALNLSPMAISKALHNAADVSEETKKLVRQEVKRQNYKPNLAARALRKFGK